MTNAGKWYEAIIHVAGINMFWRATAQSIRQSVVFAMRLVNDHDFSSVAFPIIGAGTGVFGEDGALSLMREALNDVDSPAEVFIVR